MSTDADPSPAVLLRCPRCKREEKVQPDYTDPPGTRVMEFLCYECNPSGFESIAYFDIDGNRLTP